MGCSVLSVFLRNLSKDLVVEEIEVSGEVNIASMFGIGDVGDHFLQGPVGLEISAQDIGITGMLHTAVRGGQLTLSDIAVNVQRQTVGVLSFQPNCHSSVSRTCR